MRKFLFLMLLATQVATAAPAMRFERIGLEQGLSQSGIYTIMQGRRGFLWFGTQDGLNRYDGYQFKIFRNQPGNDRSLINNDVTTLLQDRLGTIWVGTYGGVCRYHPDIEQFDCMSHQKGVEGSLYGSRVLALLEAENGDIWVGTYGGGINIYHRESGEFEHLRYDPLEADSLSDDRVTRLFLDSKGTIWVGTDEGLNRYEGHKRFTRFVTLPDEPYGLSKDHISDIFEDRKGRLWVATDGGGLNYLEKETGRFKHFRHDAKVHDSIGSDRVWKVFQDSRGAYWIGHEEGVDRFYPDEKRFTHYTYQNGDLNSISHSAVHAIYEDSGGLLWFGTYGGGISKYNIANEQFGHYKHMSWDKNSISHDSVMALFIDKDGKLWIGSDGGGVDILDLSSGRFEHLKHDPNNDNSLAGNKIRAIYQDNRGRMWFSIWNTGVSVYDPASGRFFHYRYDENNPRGIGSNRVSGFYQDPDGIMWLPSYGNGLDRLDIKTDRFTHYRQQKRRRGALSNNFITQLWPDEKGHFWLASDGGLIQFFPVKGTSYTFKHDPNDPASLSNDIVTSIVKDSRNQMWVGTYGGGLNRFNPASGNFSHLRKNQGLANDSIYGILEDNQGFLWISTNQGLSRFDTINRTFTNFDVDDGLQSNEFNGLAHVKSPSGELFFGGGNGFNRFYGEQIKRTGKPPKVVFTDLLRFNQSVPIDPKTRKRGLHLDRAIEQTDHVTLDHTDALVTFIFAALDFSNPSKNRYSYKLEGFDKQWIATDAQNRRATYTNLPPGNYTLYVRAAGPLGVWNDEGAALSVTVLPPPWRSWWAYGIYIVIAAMMLTLMIYVARERRRVKYERAVNSQLKQVDQLKDAFLTNTAYELRTPLNGIIGLAESLVDGVAGQLPDKANKNLALVVSSGRRLSNLINDILDFSKLSNDSLALNMQAVDLYSLADVVLTISRPLVGAKPVTLVNDVPEGLPPVIADELRLQQVLYNLVDNAVKFTPEGQVIIRARLIENRVEISVIDSGIGIAEERLDGLFKQYRSFDPQTGERSQSGSGLGLTVSRKLINLHGSTIKVESQLGKGSLFSFRLPLSDVQDPPKTLKAAIEYDEQALVAWVGRENEKTLPQFEQISAGHKFRLLLVDDEQINLEVLHDHLSQQHYILVKAQSAEQALELMDKQGPFDLVLIDIMMPRISGYELCRLIRKDWPIHDLPIILLTSRTKEEDMFLCYSAGANDCLAKPIARHELLIRVASHLKMLDITRNLERKVAERTEQLEQQKAEVEQKVAQRTHDLEQSNRSLSALSQICSEISAVLDWDKLLSAVYEHIKDLMDTEVFRIGLYQEHEQRISFELSIENGQLLANCDVTMDEKNQPSVWCIEHQQPLIINDLEEEFSFYFGDLPIPTPKVGSRPLSLIFWPLIAGGRVLGVLSVQSFHKNAYSYAELEVIRTVASTTAIALDNARAYREVEMQKDEVEQKVAQRTEQLELKNKEILSTQQQLVQSEKMASLGTLTAGVAHEINNPTNFVHVSAQNLEVDLSRFERFILDLAGDDADPEILDTLEHQFQPLHDHIRTIKDGTTRIKSIVKDLRAFTHLDADDKKQVKISETLESTINLTKTQFLELAEVVLNIEDDPELLCYPAQLSQVFMNLIVNACDAIRDKQQQMDNPDRGRIVIALKCVEKGIEISFEDNGTGMNEVTLNKLFEPFYTTKAVGEGTGLGLSISYSIIQKHHGEMRVESTLGEGTRFILFLPS